MSPESDESPAPRWLTDMLWGYMLLWPIRGAEQWNASRDDFAASLHVDDWHRRIGTEDMVSHHYLTRDGEVEETVFASGMAIVVNFIAEPRIVDGVTVLPGKYIIRD